MVTGTSSNVGPFLNYFQDLGSALAWLPLPERLLVPPSPQALGISPQVLDLSGIFHPFPPSGNVLYWILNFVTNKPFIETNDFHIHLYMYVLLQ